MGIQIVTPNTSEILSVAYVKRHQLRLEVSCDDEYIGDLIEAAIERVETYLERSLRPTVWLQTWDCFPCVLELERPPVTAITHVKYIDQAGDLVTLAADQYQTDFVSKPARILPAYNLSWPTCQTGTVNAVQVTYTGGYASLPFRAKLAICGLVGGWYAVKESISDLPLKEVPFGVRETLNSLRWR